MNMRSLGWTDKVIVILAFKALCFCVFPGLSVDVYSQNFGCFEITDLRDNGVYDKIYDKITGYNIAKPETVNWDRYRYQADTNGYVKIIDSVNYIFPARIMEGNMLNGHQHGRWFFYGNEVGDLLYGNLQNGLKDGLWTSCYVNEEGDTTLVSQFTFLQDTLNGSYTKFKLYSEPVVIAQYYGGVIHGKKIEFFDENRCRLKSISNFQHGLEEGLKIRFFDNRDTFSVENFHKGSLNGICKYYYRTGNLNQIVEYKDGVVHGKFHRLFENGILAVESEFYNGFPYKVLKCNNIKGESLDPGTLFMGNGTVKSYFDEGQFKSEFEYKNQQINGSIIEYYKDRTICAQGKMVCTIHDIPKYDGPENHALDDLNVYCARNQQYTYGVEFTVYNENGKRFLSVVSDSLDLTEKAYYVIEYSEYGVVDRVSRKIQGLLSGEQRDYYSDGSLAWTGINEIEIMDGKKCSFRQGVFRYYYPKSGLRAELNFVDGKEFGISNYYAKNGELKRVKVVKENGAIFNIFNGDTVNCTDSIGRKQGKWIGLPYYSEDGLCDDITNSIKYFRDGKPVGIWESFSGSGILIEKQNWNNPEMAEYYSYSYKGYLTEHGFIDIYSQRIGNWEIYDYSRNYLKYKGKYINGRKSGLWTTYKRNGKVKSQKYYGNE